MPYMTYHVVLPFMRNEEGELFAGEAMEAPSFQAASNRAAALAYRKAGVVAFSRTGDPQLGEFADAVEIVRYGEVPELI